MDIRAPGLYFLNDSSLAASGLLENVGSFGVHACSHLTSRARRGGWHLFFEGILTSGRVPKQTDAETALGAFLEGGFEALHALEGFYNVLLVHGERRQVHFFSDPLCSRPWYFYRRNGTVAAAPTPLAFAAWNLPMSLRRDGLYETFHALHTGNGRTLMAEVHRVRPGRRYRIGRDGAFQTRSYHSFTYRPDPEIGVDEAADRVKTVLQRVVRGVLSHPRLEGKPIHLPLTSGMDSRQLLGELLAQGHPPALLRHVRLKTEDYAPARRIAQGLDLPMRAPPLEALDSRRLVRRWMQRSAGLVNVHQFYLLHLTTGTPPGGAVGFTGYLMDQLLSMTSKRFKVSTTDPVEAVGHRQYTRPDMMRLLFPDYARLAARHRRRLRSDAASFEGPPWFRIILLDLHRRGLYYIGILDTMLADEALYFAPGAHVRALRFFETVPFEAAGDRRAYLHAMRRYFPELAAYPGPLGTSYLAQEMFRGADQSNWKYIKDVLYALGTGMRRDPTPETEHAWLRGIPALGQMHRAAAQDSALVRDGHLCGLGVKASRRLLNLGDAQAWTLMSLFSAEVAYRLLVRREPPRAVADRLLFAERS